MPGFSDIVLGNWNALKNIFNNVSDIIVRDNYEDALKQLQPFRQAKQDRDRYYSLSEKINNVDFNKIPTTKQLDTEGIDTNSYAFQNLADTEAYKTFYDAYKKKNPTYDGKTPIDIKEFNNYLNEYPEYRNELREKGIFKPMKETVKRDDNEILSDIYANAGMTPDDVSFYNSYKTKVDSEITRQNQQLAQFVNTWTPYLISSGELGKTDLDLLTKQAAAYGLQKPEAIKYEYKTVGNNLVKINPTNGKYEIIQIPTTGKEKKQSLNDLSANDLKKLTFDDLMKYPTQEIYNHIGDYSKEIQDKIYEQYPDWKDVEKTSSRSGSPHSGKKRSGSKAPKLDLGNIDFGDETTPTTPDTSTPTTHTTGAEDYGGDTRPYFDFSKTNQFIDNALKKNQEKAEDWKINGADYNQQVQKVADDVIQLINAYKIAVKGKKTQLAETIKDKARQYLLELEDAGFMMDVVKQARDSLADRMGVSYILKSERGN